MAYVIVPAIIIVPWAPWTHGGQLIISWGSMGAKGMHGAHGTFGAQGRTGVRQASGGGRRVQHRNIYRNKNIGHKLNDTCK